MIIENCKDPNIGFELYNWLIPVDQPRIEIANLIKNLLINEPENVFCVTAKEDDMICGFLFAVILKDEVYIVQAIALYMSKPNVSEEIIEMLKQWTKTKGIKKIAFGASSPRQQRYYSRNYGFIAVDDSKMVLEI